MSKINLTTLFYKVQRNCFSSYNLDLLINNEHPVAYILATQTSQMSGNDPKYLEFEKNLKRYLPKSNSFREYNPSHLISLVITM